MPGCSSRPAAPGVAVPEAPVSGDLSGYSHAAEVQRGELVAKLLALAIQQQVAAAEQLRRIALLESVFDSMAESVVVVDRAGELVRWNRTAARGGRLPPPRGLQREHLPAHFGLYLPGSDTPCPSDELPISRALTGRTAEKMDLVLRTPGAEDINLSTTARQVITPSGEVLGAVSVMRDVTAERRVSLALARAREDLRRVLDGVPSAIGVVREGTLVYANPASAALIGMPSTESMVGRPVDDFLLPLFRMRSAFLPGSKRLTGSRQLLQLLAIFQELTDFPELAGFHVAVRGMSVMTSVFDENGVDE